MRARQRPGSIGARLFKQLGRGGRSTPTGSPAEFGQAPGDPLSLISLMGLIPDQNEPKNLPMLRFRGTSVLRRRLRTVSVAIAKGLCCQALQ